MRSQFELSTHGCTGYNLVRLSTELSVTIETCVYKDLCVAQNELKQKSQ